MSDDDKTSITGMLEVAASNLEKFGNAGSDPIGAVEGAVNIIGVSLPILVQLVSWLV